VKGTLRGRSFRTAATTLGASSLSVVLALGCASPQPPPVAAGARAAPRPAAAAPVPQEKGGEVRDQRDAQHAWCVYLEALYLRAADHAKSWPKFHECTEVTTMASPSMLRSTADCSLRALKRFDGDPFTSAYATEVSRCGADAMTSTSLAVTELAPYTDVLCGRIVACGQVDYETCRVGLQEALGAQLGRAIGAINSRGRRQLRACFSGVSCQELGPQITSCLEPIMDDLLWLPG
jgi:hypothetical protein